MSGNGIWECASTHRSGSVLWRIRCQWGDKFSSHVEGHEAVIQRSQGVARAIDCVVHLRCTLFPKRSIIDAIPTFFRSLNRESVVVVHRGIHSRHFSGGSWIEVLSALLAHELKIALFLETLPAVTVTLMLSWPDLMTACAPPQAVQVACITMINMVKRLGVRWMEGRRTTGARAGLRLL